MKGRRWTSNSEVEEKHQKLVRRISSAEGGSRLLAEVTENQQLGEDACRL